MFKPTPHRRTGRRRGAPNGNTNALKHGIYSQYISVSEEAGIQVMPADKNQDELALARVRLATCIQKQLECPPGRWLDYERIIAYYLRIIVSLTHKNAILGQDRRTAYVTVMEMISEINQEQGVS